MKVWLIEDGNIYDGKYSSMLAAEHSLDVALDDFFVKRNIDKTQYAITAERDGFIGYIKQDIARQQYVSATLMDVFE